LTTTYGLASAVMVADQTAMADFEWRRPQHQQ
jgi:hypothetical protein